MIFKSRQKFSTFLNNTDKEMLATTIVFSNQTKTFYFTDEQEEDLFAKQTGRGAFSSLKKTWMLKSK